MLSDYDYDLPPELIAQVPSPARDGSRLLHVPPDGPFGHHFFPELVDLLPAAALLVVNDTRVFPARLHARKPTGGRVEIFLVAPETDRIWRCLLRGKPNPGTRVTLDAGPSAEILAPDRVQFDAPYDEKWGEIPLPPYVERAPNEADRERYQTIFARASGAVAAPTAGLHFTDEILARLAARDIRRVAVTLHVGPGTFAPVRDDDLEKHVMHAEAYSVPESAAAAHAAARAEGRPIVAVGTTVVRTLESALDESGRLQPKTGETRLFIRPPYRIRAFDLMVTNFHMPKSTLLMLVSAFAGRERILAAYREAVAQRYRFFSYGDCMLLHPSP